MIRVVLESLKSWEKAKIASSMTRFVPFPVQPRTLYWSGIRRFGLPYVENSSQKKDDYATPLVSLLPSMFQDCTLHAD